MINDFQARINIITLGVEDIIKAKIFYEKWLGKHPSSAGNEHIVFFQVGAIVIALYHRAALAEDANREADDCNCFPGLTLAFNVSSTDKVDEAIARAKVAGADVVKPPQYVFWGGYSGYFADLDGFLWEVAWNPFIPLDANGALVLPD